MFTHAFQLKPVGSSAPDARATPQTMDYEMGRLSK